MAGAGKDDRCGRENVGKRAARVPAHRRADGLLARLRCAAAHHLLRGGSHPAEDPAADDLPFELRRVRADGHGLRHGGDDGHHLRERWRVDGDGPAAAGRGDALGRLLRRPLLAGFNERAACERADGNRHLRQHPTHGQNGACAVSPELCRLPCAGPLARRRRRKGGSVAALRPRDDAPSYYVPAGGAHSGAGGFPREGQAGDGGEHPRILAAVRILAAHGRIGTP